MELPKLSKLDSLKDVDDPIVDWLDFIDSDSKEEMEMIAEKNENIKIAYEILQRVSKSKEARMAYEARQAEIMDQLTREKTAREEGLKQGIERGIEQGIERGTNQKAIEIARNLLGLIDDETIALKTGLSLETVRNLKN